jgi:hypothetical protein
VVHGDVGGSSLSFNFVTLGEGISHFGSNVSRNARPLLPKGGGIGETLAVVAPPPKLLILPSTLASKARSIEGGSGGWFSLAPK